MQPAFPIDAFSPAATHAMKIAEDVAYARLMVGEHSTGPIEARDVLETLKPAEALRPTVVDHNAAACVIAGLWIWHDFLDAGHEIVQSIETPTASYWHAIIHRREGDFSNAKYWNRRCPRHPAMTALAAQVNDLTQNLAADKSLLRLSANGWNADAFVDLVEAVHDRPTDPRHATAVAVQRAEWQALMAATVREAPGR